MCRPWQQQGCQRRSSPCVCRSPQAQLPQKVFLGAQCSALNPGIFCKGCASCGIIAVDVHLAGSGAGGECIIPPLASFYAHLPCPPRAAEVGPSSRSCTLVLSGGLPPLPKHPPDITRGAAGPGSLTPTPPPPWKLAGECRIIGAKSAMGKFRPMWHRVKSCVSTHVFILYILGIFRRVKKWTKMGIFKDSPKWLSHP